MCQGRDNSETHQCRQFYDEFDQSPRAQAQPNALSQYAKTKDLKVNTVKTKSMVIQNNLEKIWVKEPGHQRGCFVEELLVYREHIPRPRRQQNLTPDLQNITNDPLRDYSNGAFKVRSHNLKVNKVEALCSSKNRVRKVPNLGRYSE
jgi:hypothetical protein